MTEYMYTTITQGCPCACLLYIDMWLSEGQTDRKKGRSILGERGKPFLMVVCKFRDIIASIG